jgi:dihydroxy-acid dehydratase
MAENLSSCPDLSAGQDVVLPVEAPIKSTGHLQILYGNLAPEGSVAKITGKEGLKFTGQVSVRCCRWSFYWYCYICRVYTLNPNVKP